MILPEKAIEEFKEIFEKEYGKKLSDTEASEAAHNLVNFYEILWEVSLKQAKLKHRLKKEPEEFPVDGHYTCPALPVSAL